MAKATQWGRARDVVLLRARGVYPVLRPPIGDGAVLIRQGIIRAVGRFKDLSGSARRHLDLGEVVLMPGLVNAHCHLDYTAMAGQLPPPSSFVSWLKQITATKAGWDYSDFAESWLKGARMLLETGTTTVGDIEAVPQLLPHVWHSTPLRVLSFVEMIGITPKRDPRALIREVVTLRDELPGARDRIGLSPHAPYSTLPELIRLAAAAARHAGFRVTTHVAESAAEYEMFMRGSGEMLEWLRRAGRDMSDCGGHSPIEHLDKCGLLHENLLAVHANYLGRNDPELLARRNVSIAHCPRSHVYFSHSPFPVQRLLRAGVNVCLGTDSLVTVYKARAQTVELNMFEEMRTFAHAHPRISSRRIIEMATVNAAQALGLRHRVGALIDGRHADLVYFPWNGDLRSLADAIVNFRGRVCGSMIGGKWVFGPACQP